MGPEGANERVRAAVGRNAPALDPLSGSCSFHGARFQVTVPIPPLEAVGVTYFSSSRVAVESRRFCYVPFQLGKVARSTLKVRVLSAALTE